MSETILNRVRIGISPTKESQIILQRMRDRLFELFGDNPKVKVEIDHHLTLNFLTDVPISETTRLVEKYNDIKNKHVSSIVIDPQEPYDDTIHKIKCRKSFVNGNTYVTLTPHNSSSVYKNFILNPEISPHITLLSLAPGEEIDEDTLEQIKRIRDEIICGRQLYCDVSKIYFRF